ncbi:sarcosine oxidase subunit gamma [Rhizobiaceae bacterium n13]|uniref:sarcosine oxidase subunit gamma family protein n=1 Tax=Ferirhizobium litorale TaxID=2927786 RepID=UPI0024B2D467|nr:sarcosine oxidase subunit gamma family protein [Fererhizobium litorale]MDI7860657.1 sarcosine oxidase subunit gamma [Fererhizobium litorale]
MSLSLQNRHALEGHISGFSSFSNANHLSIVRGVAVISVLVQPQRAEDARRALATIAESSARSCGPFEWLIVSETRSADSLLQEAISLDAASVDQSDGRVVMRIAGPDVRRILGKCVAVDLHPDSFAEGYSANLLIARIGANLARLAGDCFEIVVDRSNAVWLFEELVARGREFDLSAGFVG